MPRLILIRPILTEKTMLMAQAGQFTFEVETTATKQAIAHTVAEQFKVDVINVRSSVIKGKVKRTGKRRLAKQNTDGKKAIITLKSGQMIEYFKLPEQKTKKAKKS